MPLYTYMCQDCQSDMDAYRDIDSRHDAPECKCGGSTKKIITTTMVAPQFQSYKAMAGDQRMIHSKNEHRSFLAENGLEEVGNETLTN